MLALLIGALYGGLGVVLGAFGAHALKARLEPAMLATWDTAVLYQLVHGLALLLVALIARTSTLPGLSVAMWSFAIGVLLFSGSLYVLALGGPRWLGPVTPLGGVAFIVGWLAIVVAAVRGEASV
ncbi:MAG: DUF423 domain-containing protein [Pseudomonadaceae bacterium]|nr:DUF423 domain-containing protein [Pseudomonadaceae bacterium]